MKEKIKGILAVVAVFALGLLMSGNVLAAKPAADTPIDKGWSKAKTSTGMESTKTQNADDVVQNIITFLIWAVGILAVIVIIIGGIFYVTSAGDPGKIKRAKDTIMYGIVGLVIAVMAFVIVNFVMNSILSQ